MTLVALAGYPIIALSHQIQQKQTDESVKPKEMDVSLAITFNIFD
jgi:hypothetical protein